MMLKLATGGVKVPTKKDPCLLLEKEKEKEPPWIIDSGYSTHMSGSKRKFIFLQPHKGGLVVFGGGDK